MRRLLAASAVVLGATALAAQPAGPTRTPQLWTDEALAGWALPIAGVNATPTFYSEAEYYAAPIDELRTYPVYVKDREPKGYRDWILKQGPQPLVALEKLKGDADWIAAGQEVFDGMDLGENRITDRRAFA